MVLRTEVTCSCVKCNLTLPIGLWFWSLMYNKILATNDVSTSVCRTRVARLSWKTVSHPSSTSSVKGKLGGQAWLTQVPCFVR